MVVAWLALACMIIAYGFTDYLQAIAAVRTQGNKGAHPRLLLRLAQERVYLAGVGCQVVGMVTSVIARHDLPLFLVQAAIGGGIAVTAVLGVVFLHWKLRTPEMLFIALTVVGVTLLVISAQPGESNPVSLLGACAVGAVLIPLMVAAHFAARLQGALGAVTLGTIAGCAFGMAAVASRPLLEVHSFLDFVLNPLLYVFGLHVVAGQLFCGMALQRGATTAAAAAMVAAGAIPPAAIGLMFLGDAIKPGMDGLAFLGFVVTVGATIALTRYAEPQSHVVDGSKSIPTQPPGGDTTIKAAASSQSH